MRAVDDMQWSVSRAIGPRVLFHLTPFSLLGLIVVALSLTRHFELTHSSGFWLYSEGKSRKMTREEKVQGEREKGKVRFHAK
jgi:hypothetical protein